MRNCIVLFFCMSLIVASEGYCATVGNPIETLGNNKFAISAEKNMEFSRELENGPFLQSDIKDAYQMYAKGSYGFTDYFNIYAKVGISDLEHKFKDPESLYNEDFDIEYDIGPLWGVGILAATPRWHGFNVGLDFQYAGWYVEVEDFRFERQKASEQSGEVLVTELQGAFFISYNIRLAKKTRIVPYVGVSYLYLNNETKETIRYVTPRKSGSMDFDLDNTEEFNVVVGGDIIVGENFSVTFEGTTLYDNKGVMVGVTYKF